MAAQDLISFLSQALYVIVFVAVAVEAVRHPRHATIDTALLFGTTSLVVAETWVFELVQVTPPRYVGALSGVLILALPYLLLRLLDDFTAVSGWLLRAATAGLILAAVALFARPQHAPLWLTLLEVLYFVTLTLLATVAFFRAGALARGITRRRLLAVGTGSAFVAVAILAAGLSAAAPFGPVALITQVLSLASGVAYLLGFAPPRWLRRAWQAPEVQRFFSQAAGLAHLPDERAVVAQLEQGVADALGFKNVYIGLWNEAAGVLEFAQRPWQLASQEQANLREIGVVSTHGVLRTAPGVMLAGGAFVRQQAVFSANPEVDDPEYAAVYRRRDIGAVMAAPMTAAGKRLGVVVVYSRRAALFAENDAIVLGLLADYSAVVIESWALIQESARVRAQQELEQLKDEFLAAAAHDLKTPLTSIKGLSQMIQRRLGRGEPDLLSIASDLRLMDDSSARMTGLIDELLDISRMQMDRAFDLDQRPVDLVAIVRSVVDMQARTAVRHELQLQASENELIGTWDGERLERVVSNLVENAIKYSPRGGQVTVSVKRERRENAEWAVMAVADSGMGVPKGDLQRIFERFQRGSNAAQGKIAGTGIGLAYVRQVVEQHGGEISIESSEGEGATFTVRLPLAPVAAATAATAAS